MYKIGVIGTFGVGKTTFVHRLFSELKYRAFQVEMVPELSRLCPFDINESGSVARGQYWILKEQIRLELEHAERLPDFLLCDRCVFDNTIFAERGAELGYVDPAVYRAIKPASDNWRRTYSFLVYISLDDHLRLSRNRGMEDGVRSTNEEFQVDIDRRIREAIGEARDDTLVVGGGLNRRLDMTMAFLAERIGDDRLRSMEFALD
ncbi:MAG: AAA family ATPase [bacterium]|nr:AAA family ATPase [bacterium]